MGFIIYFFNIKNWCSYSSAVHRFSVGYNICIKRLRNNACQKSSVERHATWTGIPYRVAWDPHFLWRIKQVCSNVIFVSRFELNFSFLEILKCQFCKQNTSLLSLTAKQNAWNFTLLKKCVSTIHCMFVRKKCSSWIYFAGYSDEAEPEGIDPRVESKQRRSELTISTSFRHLHCEFWTVRRARWGPQSAAFLVLRFLRLFCPACRVLSPVGNSGLRPRTQRQTAPSLHRHQLVRKPNKETCGKG